MTDGEREGWMSVRGDADVVVRGIPGNSNVLRWLLGREPTSWKDLLRREVKV